jgi:hypothetical protein
MPLPVVTLMEPALVTVPVFCPMSMRPEVSAVILPVAVLAIVPLLATVPSVML